MNHWERVMGMHAAYRAVLGAGRRVTDDQIEQAAGREIALIEGLAAGAGDWMAVTAIEKLKSAAPGYGALMTCAARYTFRDEIHSILCLDIKVVRPVWSDLDPDDAYLTHIYDHRKESDREFLGETVFSVEASPGWRELFPGFTEDVWFRETPGGIQILKEDDLDDPPEPDEEGARLDRIDDDERDREHFGG